VKAHVQPEEYLEFEKLAGNRSMSEWARSVLVKELGHENCDNKNRVESVPENRVSPVRRKRAAMDPVAEREIGDLYS